MTFFSFTCACCSLGDARTNGIHAEGMGKGEDTYS